VPPPCNEEPVLESDDSFFEDATHDEAHGYPLIPNKKQSQYHTDSQTGSVMEAYHTWTLSDKIGSQVMDFTTTCRI
jgi:hypothetical protein